MFKMFNRNKKTNSPDIRRNKNMVVRMFNFLTKPTMQDIGMIPVDTNDGIRQYLTKLRQVSKSMTYNDSYVKKYISVLVTNLVGEKGIRPRCAFKGKNNELLPINKEIEKKFELWGKKDNCSICKRYSWLEITKLVVQHTARDGEVFVRLMSDPKSKYGLSLHIIEASSLDENLNREKADNQNRIIMGVEVDDYLQPINYHFTAQKTSNNSERHIKVNANEIIHVFMPLFATQIRGIPWNHAAMHRLHNISKYEEAEITAARVEACKMGFMSPPVTEDEENSTKSNAFDEDGNFIMDVSPGSIAVLEPGMEFKEWNPSHPNGNASEFIKSSLLGAASGLDVSYASLSSDLSRVNFSSVRHGEIKDRDRFKLDQMWLVESFVEPVFKKWIYNAMLKNELKISPTEIENYFYPEFITKRWDWVDPLKDVKANIEAINNGLKSRSQIVAEMGRDIEDVFREISEENKMATELGIIITDNKNMLTEVLNMGDANGENA